MITISIATLKWIIAGLATIAWLLWSQLVEKKHGGGDYNFSMPWVLPLVCYLLFWIVWLIIF